MKSKAYILLILLITAALILFSGCRSRRIVTPSTSSKQKLETVKRCNISNMGIIIKNEGQTINLHARAQFVRDSIIAISIMPLGLEMGYAELTNNKFTIINKLSHKYAQGTIEDLKTINILKPLLQSATSININNIADIVLGRPPKPVFATTRDFPPSKATVQSSGYNVSINYKKWAKADNNVLIPLNTTISVDGKAHLTIDIQINKITMSNAGKFRQNATAKYLRTSVDNILDF